MPNTFLKPSVITAVALERLRRELVLPRLVSRKGLADFRGALNDTINIRVPAVLAARDYEFRTRVNPIVLDTIAETSVPLTLDKHPYSAVAVTDEELTLDIDSFARQVLEPQVIGVAEKLEGYLATVMQGVVPVHGTSYYKDTVTYTEQAVPKTEPRFYNTLLAARKILNDNNIPKTDRLVVIGSGIEKAALGEDAFRQAQQAGDNTALRAAFLGNVAGFDVFATNSLPVGFGVAFHRSAFVFASIAPEVPAGVPFGASQSESDLALRWIRDYDPNYMRDRSVISAFAGSSAVRDGPLVDVDPGGPVDNQASIIRAVRITSTLL